MNREHNMKTVTVVIPSYNRAKILPKTIPTYLQPDVNELIIIDDCSSDNTEQVVKKLQKKYPIIKYFRNEVNSKQTFSKNVGIKNATCDYIYFGDDDSIIKPGTIKRLIEVKEKYNFDLVGARYLTCEDYCSDKISKISAYEVWKRKLWTVDGSRIANLEPFRSFFCGYCKSDYIEVPYVHACFLTDRSIASNILFNTFYTGCALREETDFIIRCLLNDKKIAYVPDACQINLAPKYVKSTGARTGGQEAWLKSALECNEIFFKKYWNLLKEKFNLTYSLEQILEQTSKDIKDCSASTNKFSLYEYLYFNLYVAYKYRPIGLEWKY